MYNFSTEIINDICILIVNEERLTYRQSSELDTLFKKTVMFNNYKKIIIEFDRTEFIDSTVIGSLLNYKRYLQQLNSDLSIVCLNNTLLPQFYISKINTVVNIFESRADALAA